MSAALSSGERRVETRTFVSMKDWERPEVINTDKAPTYAAAPAEKGEGKCPEHLVHRQARYLNNVIVADHGKLKQLIKPVRGFKTEIAPVPWTP